MFFFPPFHGFITFSFCNWLQIFGLWYRFLFLHLTTSVHWVSWTCFIIFIKFWKKKKTLSVITSEMFIISLILSYSSRAFLYFFSLFVSLYWFGQSLSLGRELENLVSTAFCSVSQEGGLQASEGQLSGEEVRAHHSSLLSEVFVVQPWVLLCVTVT